MTKSKATPNSNPNWKYEQVMQHVRRYVILRVMRLMGKNLRLKDKATQRLLMPRVAFVAANVELKMLQMAPSMTYYLAPTKTKFYERMCAAVVALKQERPVVQQAEASERKRAVEEYEHDLTKRVRTFLDVDFDDDERPDPDPNTSADPNVDWATLHANATVAAAAATHQLSIQD